MTLAVTLRVLIVDDEAGIRTLVRRSLANDWEFFEAAGGQQALSLDVDTGKLDLLITDQLMPEMEGHELARRLRLKNPDLRVLYLTGHSDRLFEAKKHMWNFEAYLDKPFTPQALRQAVALLVFERLDL